MKKSLVITELLASYRTYSSAAELESPASTDAPATSAPCASASISWVSGQLISETVDGGC
ncbi:hypothetical protein ACLMAJ_31015 [Nocardia sp. KC 131]|uniref:hypothetical protein n=1 Tax=Nocardia arseniciresistens TaxID=3392119 RepID=UPI00398F289D